MDVTSLSSSDFGRIFGSIDQSIRFSDTDNPFDEDDSTNGYRAWLIAAYCVLLTVGLVSNVCVASVIACVLRSSHRHLGVLGPQTATAPRAIQIYILTLCCSDSVVLAFLIFPIADLIYGHWIAPSSTALCRLYLCTESLNKFCGPFLLVALSGYCYVSVCKRHWKTVGWLANNSTTISALVIIVCFSLVLLLITPVYVYGDVQFLIVHNSTTVHSVTPKCALQPPESILTAFTTYSFICGYVIPAFLFTFFYASILHCAYNQVRTRAATKNGQRQAKAAIESGKRRGKRSYLSRVVKTSMGLVLFYLVCWTPYYTMCLHQYLTPHHSMHESNAGVVLGYLVHTLPYINCTGYPILYTVLNKTIKDAYRRSTARRHNSVPCSRRLLFEQNPGIDIKQPPSCLIELSVAISTSFASNSQIQTCHLSKVT